MEVREEPGRVGAEEGRSGGWERYEEKGKWGYNNGLYCIFLPITLVSNIIVICMEAKNRLPAPKTSTYTNQYLLFLSQYVKILPKSSND